MRVDTAVVLAGGTGTRLGVLTKDIPKAMLKVRGKPLLEWIIEWLADNGVKNVVIGVAYLKENIMNYFRDGSKYSIHITYSVHTVEGGTAQGFRRAIDRYVSEKTFFALNGDQITDLDLKDLADFHMKGDSLVTMAVINPRCPYGHIIVDDKNSVIGFLEKPLCLNMFCNSGIYVFNRDILRYIPETGDIEAETFPLLTKLRLLKAYPFSGFFITVNTNKDWIEAEEELKRRYR